MGRLADKVAVITGASQGIGYGVAQAYLSEGASLVISGRRADKLEEARQALDPKGKRVIAVPADTAIRDDANRTIAAAIENFGRLDILVNNAQASKHVTIEDITDEAIQLTFGSGFLGTVYHMQAALPHLKARGGSVINFGSRMGIYGEAGYGLYGSTKEAIRALTRTACREWGQWQIRVNVLNPAGLSPSVEGWYIRNPEVANRHTAEIPLGRMGRLLEDVAPVAVFLASDDSIYVSGQTIACDGGLTML